MIKTPMKVEEWDAEIRQHSLHLKYDSQLFFLEESIEEKIPRVNRDLMEILLFPDSKKAEICHNLIESGEILDYFGMEIPAALSVKDQEKIDAEYQHEVEFYTHKLSFLKEKLTYCQKEMELRADGLVVRKPKGTTYYVDFDNGHDVNNDGSTATKTNGDGPWATLDKCGSTLTAGDVAKVRRGMTQAVSQDLAFTNDGTPVAPITIEADFDDDWSDETVAGQTATLIFGSKTVTFAGDISGDIAAGDWIYEATEDNREFAYEVASVSGGSNEIVTLYLPYKGAISGAGKTINIMPDNPIWNTAAGDFEVNLDGDNYWKIQGIHFRGTDSNGIIEIDSVNQAIFKDLICTGNHSGSDVCFYSNDDNPYILVLKCRGYDCTFMQVHAYNACLAGEVRDCFHDGNATAASYYFKSPGLDNTIVHIDTEMVGITSVMANVSATIGASHGRFRNCPFTVTGDIVDWTSRLAQGGVYFEDYDGTLGDNRQFGLLSTNDNTPFLQTETGTVKTGATSIKVTPGNDLINDNYETAKIKLFEYPIYAVKDVAKTYTAYCNLPAAEFTDAPLATELWIEAEYWGHDTTVLRRVVKSTGTVAADGSWDPLAVTVTPLQTGVLYLRAYYCKPKEAGKTNVFYTDTVVVVT